MLNERCATPGRALLALFAVTLLAACATTPPDPALLRPAEDALALAEQAGAAEDASLELGEAREYYDRAVAALAAEDLNAVRREVEMAEIQARLAIVRTQGAQARDELADKRRELDALRAQLRDLYGDQIDLGDDR